MLCIYKEPKDVHMWLFYAWFSDSDNSIIQHHLNLFELLSFCGDVFI